MLAPCTPKQNYFPAALADAEYERLLPILELIPYESGSRRETAVAGNKGAVGIAVFTGDETTPNSLVAQNAGRACQLKASLLRMEFRRGGQLRYLLLGFTQALITQMAQTAVHNRKHAVEQLLCRRLPLSIAAKGEPGCLLFRNTAILDRLS